MMAYDLETRTHDAGFTKLASTISTESFARSEYPRTTHRRRAVIDQAISGGHRQSASTQDHPGSFYGLSDEHESADSKIPSDSFPSPPEPVLMPEPLLQKFPEHDDGPKHDAQENRSRPEDIDQAVNDPMSKRIRSTGDNMQRLHLLLLLKIHIRSTTHSKQYRSHHQYPILRFFFFFAILTTILSQSKEKPPTGSRSSIRMGGPLNFMCPI